MFEFGATNNKFSIGITKGSVCDFITKRRLDVPYIFFDTVTGTFTRKTGPRDMLVFWQNGDICEK